MPSVHFDGQSFSVKGRRIWLNAAEFDYALASPATWARSLDAARGCGFNAVVAGAPWALHEARAGRISFRGALDVGAFAKRCAERDLWLVLRIGPVIAGSYEGGALPAWLSDIPGIQLRERNPLFFERVTHWYRALADALSGLQATNSMRNRGREVGPLVAVQIEDDWACGSPPRAEAYLSELVRFAREVGFEVPVLTANRSWATVETAVDIWSGWDDLAATTRQLAHLEPERPRVVVLRDPKAWRFLEETPSAAKRKRASSVDASPPDAANDAMMRMAAILAAGGQCVLGDAFSATHRVSLPGRVSIGEGMHGFLATKAREGVLFDEAGELQADSGPVRRLVAFAGSFGQVFAQAAPTQAPVVVDPESSVHPSAMPVTGAGGTVVFLFRGAGGRQGRFTTNLLLPDGRRLGVSGCDGPVAWFLLNADLNGVGVLDYSSISPFAFIERRQLVCFGPAGADAEISIDGVPMVVTVPAEGVAKPAVVKLKNLVVVVCNNAQIDRATITSAGLVVGGLLVELDGGIVVHEPAERPKPTASTIPVGGWQTASCELLAKGMSHRFALLDGPATFAACGARDGYGWYRMTFRRPAKANGKTLIHAPALADRATLWVNGDFAGVFGAGPGAKPFPAEIALPSGDVRVVMLVEQLGRPIAGENLGRRAGAYGPIFEVAPMRVTAERERGDAVDPFSVRSFLHGVNEGDLGDGEALVWRIQHRRKSALLLDLGPEVRPGVLVVNDVPIARVSADGPQDGGIVLDPASLAVLKQGSNVVRLVLDGSPEPAAIAALAKSAAIYEIVQPLGGTPDWGFARWGTPETWINGGKLEKRIPAWFRGSATVSEVVGPLRLDLSTMGKGRAFVNGHPIGRYSSRDAAGHGFSGESSLFVPASLLVAGTNEVVLFDEFGSFPKSIVLRG